MNVYLIGDSKINRAPVPGCSIRNLKKVFMLMCVIHGQLNDLISKVP